MKVRSNMEVSMNLKELDKRISEILNTEYHSDEFFNQLFQMDKIKKLIRREDR